MIHKISQKSGYVKYSDAEQIVKNADGTDLLASLSGKLPTSTTGLSAGDLYNDSGTVKVKAS